MKKEQTPQTFAKEELELFNSVEEELGEITDFEISRTDTDLIFKYKQNGEDKIMITNNLDGKFFIQCIVYCSKRFARK